MGYSMGRANAGNHEDPIKSTRWVHLFVVWECHGVHHNTYREVYLGTPVGQM